MFVQSSARFRAWSASGCKGVYDTTYSPANPEGSPETAETAAKVHAKVLLRELYR
jgi:hypothetical protein